VEKLEEDSKTILQFMASNGLVANEFKTVFMIINSKKIQRRTGEKNNNL
jgi:hypothetical protein